MPTCKYLLFVVSVFYFSFSHAQTTIADTTNIGWPAYGATPGGTHFSPATQITPNNVDQLVEVWRHQTGDYSEPTGNDKQPMKTQTSLQVTPILIEDRLYFCSPFNRVFAVDAATGEELWNYDPKVNYQESHFKGCRGVSSWQSGEQGFCEHRIIAPTLDGRLLALDADSGKPCTDFGSNGEIDLSAGLSKFEPWEYGVTSPPAILNDTVISGSFVLDNRSTDVPSGVVRAFDVRSGKQQWAWNPVPPNSKATNEDGTLLNGTTNVWSIISVDSERNMVFLPTGNTSPDFYGGHRDGSDYYSSSVVALDGSSGEVIWHYQLVHHDVWDYDTPAQPTLIDLTINGETVPAIIQVTKMGMTFALHRETGEPLWPVAELPVPQTGGVPEEPLAATQPFPSHIPHLLAKEITVDDAWGLTPLDTYACEKKIAALKNQGLYTPPSIQGSAHFPYSAGGNNWGTPTIDPDKKIMVVYTSHVLGQVRLKPREQCANSPLPQLGTPYCAEAEVVLSPLGVPCNEPPWGTLDAVDLEAGKLLWRVPLGTTRDLAPFPMWWIKGLPGIAAPMMTKGGLVFSGITNEHTFRAFDVNTGEEVWSARLPTAANALPMSYQLSSTGKQYVVVAAGGHWSGGSPAGDYLIAYALKD